MANHADQGGGMYLNKKISVLVLLIFSMVMAAGLVFSSASGEQKEQRSDCEKACRKAHNECRQVPGANLPECRKAYEGCLESCKAPTPSPEPTLSPSPELTPSPTPVPSPEMTPSPTPVPSPEMTPSPTPVPSPEMTPSPTPSPSPEVTPTPSPTP